MGDWSSAHVVAHPRHSPTYLEASSLRRQLNVDAAHMLRVPTIITPFALIVAYRVDATLAALTAVVTHHSEVNYALADLPRGPDPCVLACSPAGLLGTSRE